MTRSATSTVMRHIANGGSWTRSYAYDEASLIEAGEAEQPAEQHHGGQRPQPRRDLHLHDAHGNDVHGA